MLLSLKIKNFKSIKAQIEISFEASSDNALENAHVIKIGKYRVLKLCALYGPNASGKTNILLALNFIRNFIVYSATRLGPNANTGTDPFIFDSETQNKPSELEISFFIDDILYIYQISADNKKIYSEKLIYYPKGQSVIIYERSLGRSTDETTYTISLGTPINDFLKKFPQFLIPRKNIPFISSILQVIEIPLLKTVYDWFDNYLYKIIRPSTQGLSEFTTKLLSEKPEYKKYILSILSSSDFGCITDIIQEDIKLDGEIIKLLPEKIINNIKDNDGNIFAKHMLFKHSYENVSSNLPFEKESRGTQRYFELSGPLALLIKKNCMFFIDEFGTSIHPELQSFFIDEFIRHSNRSQLFITTHNTQLMDLDIFRRDEIWFTDKSKKNDGSTICYSLSDIKGIRKEGSYRRQYNAGKFGAKPKPSIMEDL